MIDEKLNDLIDGAIFPFSGLMPISLVVELKILCILNEIALRLL